LRSSSSIGATYNPGHLNSGRPGADDDEREPRIACVRARLGFGGFEGGEEATADGQCAFERLDPCGVRPPFVMAEVRVVGTAGDDQRVVTESPRHRHRRDGAQVQLTRVEIEIRDVGQYDANVAVALEDPAERIRDLASRKRPGSDLVGQRLKEVEIAAVDEGDLDRRTPQLQDRLKATETSADDDDAVSSHRPRAFQRPSCVMLVARAGVSDAGTQSGVGVIGCAAQAMTSLGATLREGAVPSPGRWSATARFLPQINEVVRSDEMLAQRWLPQWEKLAERSWASALEEAVEGRRAT